MSTMTIRRRLRLTATATALLLALVACGGGDDASSTASEDESASEDASATEEDSASEDESASEDASAAEGSGEGLIWVGLPDTASSARWEDFDRPAFEAAFDEAGLVADTDYIIANAEGDPQNQQTQAEQALTQGATVIVLTNLDSGSGAAIHEAAKAAGAAVIDYDRLTLDGQADFYVSFDNTRVGELQGETLVQCVEDAGIEEPNFVMLRGSPDDNNATLFGEGADSVLTPLESEGWTRVDDQAVPDWDNADAQTIFEQMLTGANNEIDAVLAANDGLGNAAIVAAQAQGLTDIQVTGQDATPQGLQNIALGTQCMTVYKSVNEEAAAAAEAAIALRNGEEVEADETVDNGTADVPSLLLDPVAITAENLSDPIDDGFVALEDVCTGDVAETEFCTSQ